MKTLYIDCGMGAAGDMLSGALLELMSDVPGTINELNAIGVPGVIYKRKSAEKCGIKGSQFVVTVYDEEEGEEHDHHHDHDHDHDHDHHHHHHHGRTLERVEKIINGLKLDTDVKNEVLNVYKLIAGAESKVHGQVVEMIHFHEVGDLDAIADITAFCYMLKKLKPEKVVASPVNVGSGQVKCAHGILPVPAPATAVLLSGIPNYGSEIRGELCTPTGAALLKNFVDEYDDMPVMTSEAIGYGLGKKDFERANCVRMFFGEEYVPTSEKRQKRYASIKKATSDELVGETVTELVCDVDDMTGEEIGFACENLLTMGALDVFTISIYMKKNRPGTEIHVLCNENDKDNLIAGIFKFTSTLGIREKTYNRYILNRTTEVVDTPMGQVRLKKSEGFGTTNAKYEYEDLAWIAREKKVSLAEARKMVDEAIKDKKK
ncbi:MAG: nickel pincer cofactor biosynthesis protein LarC [Lachnospiraceae bacterium]|nr:nickel pincer cofactor biosynthesis protein LarC [Lachnospiraceae bacterium]